MTPTSIGYARASARRRCFRFGAWSARTPTLGRCARGDLRSSRMGHFHLHCVQRVQRLSKTTRLGILNIPMTPPHCCHEQALGALLLEKDCLARI
jgi:hypothetical protein